MKYTCPNGHEIETNQPPVCHKCDLVATHYNAGTGQVYSWIDRAKHERNQERLQDAMDEAFDNQYFKEW